MNTEKRNKLLSLLTRLPPSVDSLPFVYSSEHSAGGSAAESAGHSFLGRVQAALKNYGVLYGLLLDLVGPVVPLASYSSKLSRLISSYSAESIILNYGCGPRPIPRRPDILNADIFPFGCVDLLVDPGPLPIRSFSVDLVLSIAVLEHVKDPDEMVSEIYRLLKPSGTAFCFVPFMQPIHSAPGDFRRWTPEGLQELFSSFNVVDISVASGPSSSLSWILAAWLASFLSFGSQRLFDVLYLICLPMASPLKFFDRLFPWMGKLSIAASGFCVICSKD